MRKIIDYKDIRKLGETRLDESLKKGVVIAATTELASAMSAYYPEYTVYGIHDFIAAIIPEWHEDVKDLKNYVMLRNVIENYVNDNEVNQEVSVYLRRNAYDMWNAIKLLIEADVYPDDVDSNCAQPIKHFANIWKKLEIENTLIMSFRTTFSFELAQREAVVQKIQSAVGELRENLFLFGFYFVTPIEERIFDVLEAAQYKLNFVNCHDKDYGYATKIWEAFFPEEYNAGTIENIQEDISLQNCFGEALAGNLKDLPLTVTKHQTEFEFAGMVKEAVDKGELVYSPDAQQCEQVLKEYYPEYYNRKHLLSYPVGQYIYYLHMMWNSFKDEMDLRFEYVYKCFASGWLCTEKMNGREYTYELKVLEPFFKGCYQPEEWKKRVEELKQAKETVSGFEAREKGQERWHKLLGNPFNNVGVYSVDIEKINNISILIDKLIEDASYLFAERENVDLYAHFRRIKEIINTQMSMDDILAEESEIAKELLTQFDDENAKGIVCPINGVRDAIILLIGNHYGEYESQESETSGRSRMVHPLSMVEAAMLNNYGQKIHIVMANEFTLPGQPKKLPWPLTNDVLDSLKVKGREKTEKYVRYMRAVIDDRPLSYRYLFFSFMGVFNAENRPELSVEWVCSKDKKEIAVSPYIKLMGFKEPENEIEEKGEKYKEMITASSEGMTKVEVHMPEDDVPEEVRMDYLLCKKRYSYSYLLNELPSFTSEFHYSFELSKLISAFAIISDLDKEVIEKNINELFPFFRRVELRQSADFASNQGIPSSYAFGDIEYPAQRLLTHFLDSDVIREARAREDIYNERKTESNSVPIKACMYCPYSNICIERHREEVAMYE